jgi:hypothetical protein
MDIDRFEALLYRIAEPTRRTLLGLAGSLGLVHIAPPLDASSRKKRRKKKCKGRKKKCGKRCIPKSQCCPACAAFEVCVQTRCLSKLGTCDLGADICTNICPQEGCVCGSNNSCLCYQTVTGDTRCGTGQGCGNCTSDAECETRLGAGAFCVATAAPQCVDCGDDTGFCASPCLA